MQALRIHAGPAARRHIEQQGLRPEHIGVVPGAAGGPKGLILGPLDRFIFGEWLARSAHPVDLVGASIGAWRMATACLDRPVEAFERLERDYIRQDYAVPPGRKRPTAEQVSREFGNSLQDFYGGRIGEVLGHRRYRLHVVTSRGRHVLGREHRLATPLGYLGAFVANSVHRRALGGWLERVVFSTPGAALPFATGDYRTRQVALAPDNFNAALQASCSIPFVLQAVHDIPGAPRGAYWDGGITDYHLHLDYRRMKPAIGQSYGTVSASGVVGEDGATVAEPAGGIVLYPHFQQAVVPGWLDKGLRRRHRPTAFLDNMVVLAPNPEWVATLPNAKLPDRNDFMRYAGDLPGRVRAWSAAAAESRRLADEWASWLERPDPVRVLPL